MKQLPKGFVLFLFFSLNFSLFAQANGVTPYLPANMSAQFDNDIEKLAVLTDIPQLTKPYNVTTVLSHLKKIQKSHPALYKRLDNALAAYSSNIAISHARFSLSSSDSEQPFPLANQMGSTSDQTYRFKAHGHWQETSWLGVYGGIDTSNERTVPSGSLIALGTSWAQLDIGYKERWWSPFQGSAQMISTNVETLPSVGLSNNTPIELFGTAFNYDFFVAQTSRQLVLYQGEWTDTNKPFFSGMHFSLQPVEWWSIGVNRMFQFGGGERDTGLKDVLRAVFDPRGADNTSGELSQDDEAGNQIASIVSKMNFDGFSIYMEYAGEDTSNNKAWQLGNSAINVGVFLPSLANLVNTKTAMTYEYSEWQNRWYVHHLYNEGLTHYGAVIGHSAHQNTIQGNYYGESGSSNYLKIQTISKYHHVYTVKFRTIKYNSVPNGKAWQAELTYSFSVRENAIDSSIIAGKNSEDEAFTALSFSISLDRPIWR